ncbi:DUF3996 domain-containing protein [Bdellovibrionota bacterium FG-1]
MNYRFWSAIALLSVTSQQADAAQSPSHAISGSHPFGLGVIIGEPSGLSAQYFFNPERALDGGLAYSFNSFIFIFSDYLFHFPGVFGHGPRVPRDLSPYLGVGGVLLASTTSNRKEGRYFTDQGSSVGLGIRLPFGLEWRPIRSPLEVFLEIAPGLGVIPSTFGFIEGGIGLRYYF